MTDSRTRAVHMLIVFIESLILAWVIVILAKYFGWHVGPPSLY